MNAATILDWAMHTGLAVTGLVVFVLIVRRPFTRHFGAGAAYSLWSLPFIRLFLPELNLTLPSGVMDNLTPVVGSVTSETISVSVLASSTELMMTASKTVWSWSEILLAIWLAGVILWLAYNVASHIKVKRALRRESRPLSLALEPTAYQAMRQIGLRRRVEIRISTTCNGPLVVGVLKPLIIVPAGFMSDYSRKQQHYALAHELAHIKRGDLWVALLGLVFRALNWPNPLIYYAARKFRADQEAACDAYVLAQLGGTPDIREGYAETLIHAARSSASPQTFTTAPLGLTIYHPLKERLMTITTTHKTPGLMSRVMASACLVTALAIATPVTLAAGDGETKAVKVQAHSKMKGKQVMKWIEEVDGVRTEKHYEILSEDGEKKAYRIGKDGSRTEVEMSEIEAVKGAHGEMEMSDMMFGHGDVDIQVMKGADGEEKIVKKRVKVIRDGQHVDMDDGSHKKVIVKRMGSGEHNSDMNVFAFSSEDDVTIDIDGENYAYAQAGSHSKIMVDVAAEMLENVNADDMSDKAKRKIEKARKALKEAQDAIAAEK